MTELPKIEPIVVRREDEVEFQQEIWQPTWNCFCCQDTGIVRPHLAKLVIDGYDWNIHKLPVCTNPKCSAVNQLSEAIAYILDHRLSATVCQQLDQLETENWKETVTLRFENIQQLANQKSFRLCNRTTEEEQKQLIKLDDKFESPLEIPVNSN
jgi:hypothetical protein